MIGSFTIYDCSNFAGAFAWGVAWKPEGGEWSEPSGYLQMTEGRLFQNVGLTGQLGTIYLGHEGVFPLPGEFPNTTVFQPGPFGPFTLENGKSYCINAQTGVLSELTPSGDVWTIMTNLIPLIMLMMMMGMMMPMTKEFSKGI